MSAAGPDTAAMTVATPPAGFLADGLALADDATGVAEGRVAEPVFVSHLQAFAVSLATWAAAAVLERYVPGAVGWAPLIGAALVSALAHAAAWWLARGKVKPLPEAAGAHAAPVDPSTLTTAVTEGVRAAAMAYRPSPYPRP